MPLNKEQNDEVEQLRASSNTTLRATVPSLEEILYKPGKFFNASLDKASEDNERNYFKIKDNQNNDIVLVQIAGLVARRIVCEANKDQELNQGDRVGMIRFGSRADVYYENYEPLVKVGQIAVSGETLLAKKQNGTTKE